MAKSPAGDCHEDDLPEAMREDPKAILLSFWAFAKIGEMEISKRQRN